MKIATSPTPTHKNSVYHAVYLNVQGFSAIAVPFIVVAYMCVCYGMLGKKEGDQPFCNSSKRTPTCLTWQTFVWSRPTAVVMLMQLHMLRLVKSPPPHLPLLGCIVISSTYPVTLTEEQHSGTGFIHWLDFSQRSKVNNSYLAVSMRWLFHTSAHCSAPMWCSDVAIGPCWYPGSPHNGCYCNCSQMDCILWSVSEQWNWAVTH